MEAEVTSFTQHSTGSVFIFILQAQRLTEEGGDIQIPALSTKLNKHWEATSLGQLVISCPSLFQRSWDETQQSSSLTKPVICLTCIYLLLDCVKGRAFNLEEAALSLRKNDEFNKLRFCELLLHAGEEQRHSEFATVSCEHIYFLNPKKYVII